MKKWIIVGVLEALILSIGYYITLPAINLCSIGFWGFIVINLFIFVVIASIAKYGNVNQVDIKVRGNNKMDAVLAIPLYIVVVIAVGIVLTNFILSPLFNAKSYSQRIKVDETGDFAKDIAEVDFNALPLLDKDSSQKLGDRVMGQFSEFVSQYYVSDQYTQINYNNEILRVTPIEYDGLIKWIANRKEGIKGYITVNSVTGAAELKKLDKGLKYMPSAFFNDCLRRKLRFSYPTEIFGEERFEIDNEGNPYWIVPTYGYTGISIKTRVTGVIILNPITGESKKYKLEEVPEWVDNAYNAALVIEQVNDWGTYQGGFFNSVFAQKNVVNTTEGYNYLAMNDDIYLYTGITSVSTDESNQGFILSNMRTGQTTYYTVAGAEEFSAMASAEGQVQQMKYTSTFPLLINLNGKATYLVSLKDDAGLVKMYGFVDVADYQKVVVTDSSKGILVAAQNYLDSYGGGVVEDKLVEKEITIKSITSASIKGNTYYYIVDSEGKKYKASIELSDNLPFAKVGDKLTIKYEEKEKEVTTITKIS